MIPLKKKRFRDTPAFGNMMAMIVIVGVVAILGVFVPRAESAPVAAPSVVQPAVEQVDKDNQYKIEIANVREAGCMNMYSIAETIMQGRQDGDPLPRMLNNVKESQILTTMAKAAYREMHYQSEEYQARAVNRFAEEQFNKCEVDIKKK